MVDVTQASRPRLPPFNPVACVSHRHRLKLNARHGPQRRATFSYGMFLTYTLSTIELRVPRNLASRELAPLRYCQTSQSECYVAIAYSIFKGHVTATAARRRAPKLPHRCTDWLILGSWAPLSILTVPALGIDDSNDTQLLL